MFDVESLVKCQPLLEARDQICATKAPWAVDGCNWVFAGDDSNYYCTGLVAGCQRQYEELVPTAGPGFDRRGHAVQQPGWLGAVSDGRCGPGQGPAVRSRRLYR